MEGMLDEGKNKHMGEPMDTWRNGEMAQAMAVSRDTKMGDYMVRC